MKESKRVRKLLIKAVKEKLTEMAFEKCSKRIVSLGRAAELAKIPLSDFMKIAAERKMPINYSVEFLKRDLIL